MPTTIRNTNHCARGRLMEIGPLGITVSTATGPCFIFSMNSGDLISCMPAARGMKESPGGRGQARQALSSSASLGTLGKSLLCQSGVMWITELARNTITADSRIGSHSDSRLIIETPLYSYVLWFERHLAGASTPAVPGVNMLTKR